MTRFASPEALKIAAEKQAAENLAHHLPIHTDPQTGETYQVSLNPYSTPGARNEWQRGFDNTPPRSWETVERDWDFRFQLGRATRRLLDEHNIKTGETRMNIRPITCREEVLLADLHTLTILSAEPCFSGKADPVNLYVENTAGEDVYIGELADASLRNLVCTAPKLADLLRGIEPGNEELDDLIEIVNLIREALNP